METLAAAILAAWGMEFTPKANAELLAVISRRQSLMHDAWLSEVGHKRPQVKPGLPIEEAKSKAAEMGRQIEATHASSCKVKHRVKWASESSLVGLRVFVPNDVVADVPANQ